jgi:predicted  nucleic acid-binding Zn-ribbon protein
MSLASLKQDLANIREKIRLMQDDVNSLRAKKEAKLKQISNEYDSEIRQLESRLDTARRREPELDRMVRKEEELQENQSAGGKKSGGFW